MKNARRGAPRTTLGWIDALCERTLDDLRAQIVCCYCPVAGQSVTVKFVRNVHAKETWLDEFVRLVVTAGSPADPGCMRRVPLFDSGTMLVLPVLDEMNESFGALGVASTRSRPWSVADVEKARRRVATAAQLAAKEHGPRLGRGKQPR